MPFGWPRNKLAEQFLFFFFGNNRREKGEDNSPHSTLNREQKLSKIQSFAPSSTFDRLHHTGRQAREMHGKPNSERGKRLSCIDLLIDRQIRVGNNVSYRSRFVFVYRIHLRTFQTRNQLRDVRSHSPRLWRPAHHARRRRPPHHFPPSPLPTHYGLGRQNLLRPPSQMGLRRAHHGTFHA